MSLTLGVGQKERVYIPLKYKGTFLAAIAPEESVKISSRNPGVVSVVQDVIPEQDPAKGAPSTVASATIEAVAAHPLPVDITAVLRLANGKTDSIVQDTVSVVKGAEKSGSLFGADVPLALVTPRVPRSSPGRAAKDAELEVAKQKMYDRRVIEDAEVDKKALDAMRRTD